MVRVKKGVSAHRKHKKIIKKAKGYYSCRSKTYKSAKQAVIKSGQYSYRDRKQKKRYFRKIWILQINAKVRKYGLTYSKFINKIKNFFNINRKILFEIINKNDKSFDKIISLIKNNK